MRNPNRIKRIVSKLYRYWEANPDLRLGQLVSNAATKGAGKPINDVFFVEDNVIESGINAFIIQDIKKTSRRDRVV